MFAVRNRYLSCISQDYIRFDRGSKMCCVYFSIFCNKKRTFLSVLLLSIFYINHGVAVVVGENQFKFCISREKNEHITPIANKMLVAFDFDKTIVQENSDLVVRNLATSIPQEVEALYTPSGWTLYMREVFKLLHSQNIKKHDIINVIHNMSAITGMDQLLKWLHDNGCETIIISDSNSVFIQEWLEHKQLNKYVAQVFTNPAFFNSDDLLNIEMYHRQDWCNLSNENLCKGQILEDYIEKRKKDSVLFEKVAFIGDGENDLCPSLRLSKEDYVFPRIDFTLYKKINQSDKFNIKASVHPWSSGQDILSVIQNTI